MTYASFNGPSLPFTLDSEGRVYTDNPDDPGRATWWGLDLPTFQTWTRNPRATAAELHALTPAEITAYYGSVWQGCNCDNLPPGADLSVFDATVNTGHNAAKQLQRIAGIAGTACDGWIGAETLAAVHSLDAQRLGLRLLSPAVSLVQSALGLHVDGVLGPDTHAAMKGQLPVVLVGALWDQQRAYYSGLAAFKTFGKGWLSRAERRATAAMKLAVAA